MRKISIALAIASVPAEMAVASQPLSFFSTSSSRIEQVATFVPQPEPEPEPGEEPGDWPTPDPYEPFRVRQDFYGSKAENVVRLNDLVVAKARTDHKIAKAATFVTVPDSNTRFVDAKATAETVSFVTPSFSGFATVNVFLDRQIGVFDPFTKEQHLQRAAESGSGLSDGSVLYAAYSSVALGLGISDGWTAQGVFVQEHAQSEFRPKKVFPYGDPYYFEYDGVFDKHTTSRTVDVASGSELFTKEAGRQSIGGSANYTFEFRFEAGKTYRVSTFSDCYSRLNSGGQFLSLSDATLAYCEADRSAYWNGLTNIRGLNGEALSGFKLMGSDGLDYAFASPLSPDPRGGAAVVPEPSTWAMMLGGFGLLGAAARRRTRTAIAYA